MLIAFKMAYTLELFQLRWKSKFSIFPPPQKKKFYNIDQRNRFDSFWNRTRQAADELQLKRCNEYGINNDRTSATAQKEDAGLGNRNKKLNRKRRSHGTETETSYGFFKWAIPGLFFFIFVFSIF